MRGSLTATLAGCGLFTAVACAGEPVVTSVNGDPATLTITVVDENSAVTSDLRLQVGDTARLAAVAINTLDQVLGTITPTWYSTRPGVASVSGEGVVAALSEGDAEIVATYLQAFALVPTAVSSVATGPPPPPDTTTPPPDTTTPPPPPPTGAFFFSADWSTAVGQSAAAVFDGGKFNDGSGNYANSFEVVPAPAGFPTGMVNVLQQRAIPESGSWGQVELYRSRSRVPLLQDGESLGLRFYIQAPNGCVFSDCGLHGFEVLDPGNDPFGINTDLRDGSWQFSIEVPVASNYADRGSDGWGAFPLRNGPVYEFLAVVTRISNSIDLDIWIYEGTDRSTLVYGPEDWPDFYNPAGAPLHEVSPFPATSSSWANLQEWRIGINGIGADADGRVMWRWGGWALCDGMCPIYTPGEGS